MEGLFEGVQGARLRTGLFAVVVCLGLFLLVQSVAAFEGLRYIGAGVQATNTITVSGHGEELAVPDIATFTFTVASTKPTVAEAQADATKKINDATAYLTAAGVDTKDIQTSDYSLSPQYEYQNAVCPQVSPAIYSDGSSSGSAVYCPGGKQVLKGYEVRQTTTVKVRDTAKAGDLLAGVGSKGATEVSQLDFTFDNPDLPQTAARNKAIANAKDKAQALADQLGVSLVRVVSYNENGNPGPIYYAKAMAMDSMAGSVPASAPAISVGQNKVSSDVSVTYEIR